MSDFNSKVPPTMTGSPNELPPPALKKLKIQIPGYDILSEIASGGQATVYRGKELTSGLTVAIKLLHAGPYADDTSRERFRRETRVLQAIDHPNIVTAIDSGTTELGLDFLVMNYVEGRPIDALWKDSTYAAQVAAEPPAKIKLFKRICDIVQAAHRKGITHRDLSPSNILLDGHGQPHILDFGLASTAFDRVDHPREVTLSGQFLGKLTYASPEQAKCGLSSTSRTEVDIRSDVYALGIILYQILTGGVYPYEVAGNFADVLNNIVHSAPLPPSAMIAARRDRGATREHRAVRPNPPLVNETIEAIVLKALEKDPDRRYESAGALAEDIDRYLAGTPTAASLGTMATRTVPIPQTRRSRYGSAIAAALAIVAIGLTININYLLKPLGLPVIPILFGASASTHPSLGAAETELTVRQQSPPPQPATAEPDLFSKGTIWAGKAVPTENGTPRGRGFESKLEINVRNGSKISGQVTLQQGLSRPTFAIEGTAPQGNSGLVAFQWTGEGNLGVKFFGTLKKGVVTLTYSGTTKSGAMNGVWVMTQY